MRATYQPMGDLSFHHVSGPNHTAHIATLPCNPHRVPSCSWLLKPVGDDGKCDWCREFDRRMEETKP